MYACGCDNRRVCLLNDPLIGQMTAAVKHSVVDTTVDVVMRASTVDHRLFTVLESSWGSW